MHEIQAAMQLSKQDDIMAYGMVTIDRSIRFMIQLKKCQTGSGEEKVFIRYPRKKEGEEWVDVIRPGTEIEKEIQETVAKAIQKEIMRDLHLPMVEDVEIVLTDRDERRKVQICGRASVKICDLWIEGITIKQGTKGLFVNMPQYRQAEGTYKDLVYAITKDLQEEISETVIDAYRNSVQERRSRGI